jgi:hypothetical protein
MIGDIAWVMITLAENYGGRLAIVIMKFVIELAAGMLADVSGVHALDRGARA